MGDFGRTLVFVGGLLLVVGVLLILVGKVNLPIGRLPGDIIIRGKNSTFYFPLMTSIVLSVILTLVLWLVNRMKRWRVEFSGRSCVDVPATNQTFRFRM